MRFLGVTETCDLGSLYLRLLADGHEVKIFVGEEEAQGTLAGLAPRSQDWRAELPWIKEAGADGIILFEAVSEGYGALQDQLRRDGFQVIGGSAFGDRLENDRAFAHEMLAGLGLKTAAVHAFADAASGDAFLAANPGRYVLKYSGPDFASSDNYVGRLADGRDVRAVLAGHFRARGGKPADYILMDHIAGVEMGVGAYFDGAHFLLPACLDWEHKTFFAGGMGELTGEMGTVATFDRSRRFFDLTLALLEPLLRAHRHVGYVNLNTIVNAEGIWPLELTCRFGYPGFAILEPLQEPWADLFRAMTRREGASLTARRGFSTGIVLTTPPFPYSRKQVDEPVGLAVFLPDPLGEEDVRNLHFGEVGLDEHGQLVTSGLYGWTMVATGTGSTIASSREAAYARAASVSIPNMRYRLDIGERLIAGDYAVVEALGLLSDIALEATSADK